MICGELWEVLVHSVRTLRGLGALGSNFGKFGTQTLSALRTADSKSAVPNFEYELPVLSLSVFCSLLWTISRSACSKIELERRSSLWSNEFWRRFSRCPTTGFLWANCSDRR